jgi:ketosteroid isomerase-like protein
VSCSARRAPFVFETEVNRVSTVNTPLIRRLFEAVDRKDTVSLARHFAEDIAFRFGNADVIEGRPAVVQTCEAFLAGLAGIRHAIEHLWQADADRVVAVMTVHYQKLDGGTLLPCANTFRMRDATAPPTSRQQPKRTNLNPVRPRPRQTYSASLRCKAGSILNTYSVSAPSAGQLRQKARAVLKAVDGKSFRCHHPAKLDLDSDRTRRRKPVRGVLHAA